MEYDGLFYCFVCWEMKKKKSRWKRFITNIVCEDCVCICVWHLDLSNGQRTNFLPNIWEIELKDRSPVFGNPSKILGQWKALNSEVSIEKLIIKVKSWERQIGEREGGKKKKNTSKEKSFGKRYQTTNLSFSTILIYSIFKVQFL